MDDDCAGGPFTTWVATWGGAGLAGGGVAGRGFMELNICVNSPGAAPDGPAGTLAGAAGGALTGRGVDGFAVSMGSGSAAFFVSTSKALRNMAVALRESACSGGSGPELELLFGIKKAVLFRLRAATPRTKPRP